MNELEKILQQKKKLEKKLDGFKGRKVRVFFDEDYTVGKILSINEEHGIALIHLIELPQIFDDYVDNWEGHPRVSYKISDLEFVE